MDLSPGRKQVLKPPLGEMLDAAMTGPSAEGLVQLHDRPIGQSREIGTGGVLIELLGVILEECA
jgi:hypothetical protein